MYDIIIIGGGPAGLTAALYARRADCSVLLLEKNAIGGQIVQSPKVENYPGTEEISGKELIRILYKQVLSLGCQIEMEEVTNVRNNGETKTVTTVKGAYEGRSVIICAGAAPKKLNVPGEDLFAGDGVSYCAVCDGAHFRKKKVAVVGGGNSGLLEAFQLTKYCSKVILIQDQDRLTGEDVNVRAILAKPNVQPIYQTVVTSIERSGALTVHLINTETNQPSAIHVDGVFVAVGQKPQNEPFLGVATLDRGGYIVADEDCLTGTPGIFVAGDCRGKRVRQITTATADGTVAAMNAVQFLESSQNK